MQGVVGKGGGKGMSGGGREKLRSLGENFAWVLIIRKIKSGSSHGPVN